MQSLMFKKVKAVFLWAIGVLLIYGAIAVLYYGFYILFWGGPLVEVYAGEFRQILSFGPGLALMILAVTMVFVGKAILTKKNEIEKELADEKVSREKETLKDKVAPYLADENREKLWEDIFDENDPEINFETIDLLLEPTSARRANSFEEDESKYDIETIDLLLEPTSAHRANSFEEDESKYDIETIDLSLGPLSMDRANGFDEDDTDLDLAPANQTPEYMSPYPKKHPDEDDTDLEYLEEE